jgi:hypothetical protein
MELDQKIPAPPRPKELFESSWSEESRALVILKKAILGFVAILSVFAVMSGYRAYFQVRSLELRPAERVLRSGTIIEVKAESYARTPVDVRLELIQGAKTKILGEVRIPRNYDPALDPRVKMASLTVALTPELLSGFEPGPAQLRATAEGRMQFGRTPPPLVREVSVEIKQGM